MIKLKQLLFESGQEAGKLELVQTPIEKAKKYAEDIFKKYGSTVEKDIPDFEKNYKLAQKKANMGKTKRKDMPVINDVDVKKFQQRLSQGFIDINKPFAPETNSKNPFPTGLSGELAKQWLKNGLKSNDNGDPDDDIVKVKKVQIAAEKLVPIQKQIYLDKSLKGTAKFGIANSMSFLKSSVFIISSDNRIIDGHHRFLSAILIDPKMKVTALEIDLPISKLLPLTLSYGDAIGNKRNA